MSLESGKPCIRGLLITVYNVLSLQASGASEKELPEDFPELEHEDILACLEFASEKEHRSAWVVV
ncbi:MAG: DUF433 domain-containing protein [Nitrospiraceae bacterium]|nr:DUF433 domain-containing protein [Nitrospiraceae bacterium]